MEEEIPQYEQSGKGYPKLGQGIGIHTCVE